MIWLIAPLVLVGGRRWSPHLLVRDLVLVALTGYLVLRLRAAGEAAAPRAPAAAG